MFAIKAFKGTNYKIYLNAHVLFSLSMIRGVEKELGLSRSAPTVEEVSVRLGLPQLSKRAHRMLRVYQEEFLRALPESRFYPI